MSRPNWRTGQRGQDFLEKDLVLRLAPFQVVVAASDRYSSQDQGFTATAIAEYFQDQGKDDCDGPGYQVCLPSVKWVYHGEPPNHPWLYTFGLRYIAPAFESRDLAKQRYWFVHCFAEGDDMNEPAADAVRGY